MLRKVGIAAIIFLATATFCLAEAVGPFLQEISVNVNAGASQGSGVIVLVETKEKEKTTWILTAEHVVKGLRQINDVIGPDGETRKQIKYRDARIIQEQVEDGRTIGEVSYDAKVVTVDPRRDIALLRVRANFTDKGAKFYLGDDILPAGTLLFHAGAPGGKEIGGTASLTPGIISRIGVRIPEFGGSEHGVFDQTSCASLPGSSGGLVALQEDGQWVGMITLGLSGGDSFNWVVPIRSIKQWTEEIKIPWLIDPKADRPLKDDFDKIPLELNPTGFAGKDTPTPAPAVVEEEGNKDNLKVETRER